MTEEARRKEVNHEAIVTPTKAWKAAVLAILMKDTRTFRMAVAKIAKSGSRVPRCTFERYSEKGRPFSREKAQSMREAVATTEPEEKMFTARTTTV